MLKQEQVNIYVDEMMRLNAYINQHGQIQKSSVIKAWHEFTNKDWQFILAIPMILDNADLNNLSHWTRKDLEQLLSFVMDYSEHCDNLLYPHPSVTAKLPKRLTHFSNDRSVKSLVFRTMMNLREDYCQLVNLDLPNEDSSIGKLDPRPIDELFNYEK